LAVILRVKKIVGYKPQVKAYCYATERVDISAIRDVKVIPKEDGKVLFDSICSDTVLRSCTIGKLIKKLQITVRQNSRLKEKEGMNRMRRKARYWPFNRYTL
jgi:hypothetical protein